MAYTTINKSTDYFDTKLFTGTGATQSVTGLDFSPDFTWLNRRIDSNNGGSALYDVNRGVNKSLRTDLTNAEATITGGLTSFDTNGFTLGSNIISNELDQTMCSWNWKAGTSISNGTNGSTQQESTVNVNTTSGFSIVSWEGTGDVMAIPHNLGVVPEMIIFKEIDGSSSFHVYHKDSRLNATTAPEDSGISLNSYNDSYSTVTMWNSTAPTSTQFFIGGSSDSYNQYGQTYVAYCFASKQGFSKCGSYLGNGNTNGPTIFTGFSPAFVLIKLSYGDTTNGRWYLNDSKRGQSGQSGVAGSMAHFHSEYPSGGETEVDPIDFLATGFKIRTPVSGRNRNSCNMIYYAIAAAPLVGTNNVPSTAV